METQEAGKVLARLTAAFPRPNMDPPTAGVWIDHLEPKVFATALLACKILERTHKRLPSIADFLEAYDEARHSTPSQALGKPECRICDDGFVNVRCADCDCDQTFLARGNRCPRYRDTVRPCPEGCLPPDKAEREGRRHRDEHDSLRERDAHRQRAIDARVDRVRQQQLIRERSRDFSEPNREHGPDGDEPF